MNGMDVKSMEEMAINELGIKSEILDFEKSESIEMDKLMEKYSPDQEREPTWKQNLITMILMQKTINLSEHFYLPNPFDDLSEW